MRPVTRVWSLDELLTLFPAARDGDHFVLRCKSAAVGHGRYIKEIAGTRHVGDVVVEVLPAPQLSLSMGHMAAGLDDSARVHTDADLLEGIVEALSRICGLAYWGCSIRTTAASG